MNRLLAHRGPDGEGAWIHGRGHVGFAHRRLEIIDLETGHQPMHDGDGNWITYNGEIYNYLELRPRARRGHVPDHVGHRGRASRLSPLGAGLRRAAARHVRLRDLGRGRGAALLRARPVRHQAFRLRAARRRLLRRLGGEGTAPLPAGDRDGPRGAQGLSRLSVLPRRQDALQRRARAPARPHAHDPERRRAREALLGSRVRARLRPQRGVADDAAARARRGVGRVPPPRRRPGRRVPLRRPRLEHHDLARGPGRWDRSSRRSRGASPTASATTRPATRNCSRTSAASACTSRRSTRPTSPRTSATSSTTSTTRSPAPDRSRSTWSRGSPRST